MRNIKSDTFSSELKKILLDCSEVKNIALEKITNKVLDKFFYGSDFKRELNSGFFNYNGVSSGKIKLDNDDVSIIICELL